MPNEMTEDVRVALCSQRREKMHPAKRFTAIDLFSGAGGLTLGLKRAGYKVLLGSDFNAACARTYRRNFFDHAFIEGDIRDISAARVLRESGLYAETSIC